MKKARMGAKSTKSEVNDHNDADYIKKCASVIEASLKSFGFVVQVAQINILDEHHEYCLKLEDGTDFVDLKKHDVDLAVALESPTGKVFWHNPANDTPYIGLRVPKPSALYFKRQEFEEEQLREGKGFRNRLAFVFFLIGQANYHIAHRILGKGRPNPQ